VFRSLAGSFVIALTVFLLVGCQSATCDSVGKTTAGITAAPAAPAAPATAAPAMAAPAAPAVPVMSAAPVVAAAAIRIKAGSSAPFTDSSGNVWLPDQGFDGGETTERAADMQIANTKDPAIYRTERYDMTRFSYKLPNGKYTVKLHFCETYDGITGAGQRVFSFTVGGHEFKDLDLWAKTGGAQRAYVETVNVEVTDGKLEVTFTPNVQSPEINGIEIIPGA
jgi:hypothetical protein